MAVSSLSNPAPDAPDAYACSICGVDRRALSSTGERVGDGNKPDPLHLAGNVCKDRDQRYIIPVRLVLADLVDVMSRAVGNCVGSHPRGVHDIEDGCWMTGCGCRLFTSRLDEYLVTLAVAEGEAPCRRCCHRVADHAQDGSCPDGTVTA